jgi:hypothetical protein
MNISLVNENGKYKVKLSGELTYDTNSISKVEEMFGVDMASYFADAVREACVNNGLVKKVINTKKNQNNDNEDTEKSIFDFDK